MDIKDYFEPVTIKAHYRRGEKNALGTYTEQYIPYKDFPAWENADIVIFGLSDYRSIQLDECPDASNQARKCLYELTPPVGKMKIADLGNLITGKTIEDTFAAIRDITSLIIENGKIPLIFGGTKDLALGLFNGYEKNEMTVNLTALDSMPGLSSYHNDKVKRKSYLSRIISSRSKFLFNYTSIGYQSYFAGVDEINILDDMQFDSFRLGKVRENISEMEPVMRDTDLLVISMSSIRQADAPASLFPSPNGFTGEEACQLAWYGGTSERLSSIALFDWHSKYDSRFHTAHQAAHIAWYFIEGYYKRRGEYPFNSSKDCTKYIVNLSGAGNNIVFYKSQKSERWWMEIPSSRLPSSLMVACSFEDYQKACRQEVPDRWWQNFKKTNY